MTVAAPVAERLVGCQQPTTLWVPPGAVSSAAAEVIDLCDQIGLVLDPWQRLVLEAGLSEAADGRWLAFEVACIVARQNGKGAIIEALELGCLFLFGDRLVIHSAHEFKTAKDGFLRLNGWLENVDWLRRRVRQVFRSNEQVGFDLKSGQRLRFMARSGGAGRGFPVDKVILDEGQILGDTQVSAVMPATSARPNPQIWYFGSAGPPVGMPPEVSQVLGRLRRRGMAGGDPQLVLAAWEARAAHDRRCRPGCGQHDDHGDRQVWARVNPGMGFRLTEGAIAREHMSMSAAAFGRERLSVGDYPAEDDNEWKAIEKAKWAARAGAAGRPDRPVALGVAAAWPDAEAASIGVAGQLGEELVVQVVEHQPGTGWVVARVKELRERHEPCAVVADPHGPAGPLVADMKAAGIDVLELSMQDAAAAYGRFYEAFAGVDPTGRHFEQKELTDAVAAAQTRPLADGFVWARRGPVDISPVEAVTWALHGHAVRAHVQPAEVSVFYLDDLDDEDDDETAEG